MDISRRKFIQSSLAISALTVLPACSMTRSIDKQGKYVYDLTAEPSTAVHIPEQSGQLFPVLIRTPIPG